MKKNKSLVVFLVDRSGSMSSVREATEKGFKDFLDKQKKVAGECQISLYQFDDRFETDYEFKDIQEATELTLKPRGWTALQDALGRAIISVGEQLNKLPEYDKPEKVIVCILTDGMENASTEFTADKVKELVDHQTNKYNWSFVFLGANQDAIFTGKKYGFAQTLSATYNASQVGTTAAFSVLSSGVQCLRTYDSYSISDSDRRSLVETV